MWSTGLVLIFASLVVISEQAYLNLHDGATCNGNWKCVRYSKCRTVQEDIDNNIEPDVCKFAGRVPIVCCRPEEGHPLRRILPGRSGEISKRKCQEYGKYAYFEKASTSMLADDEIVKVKDCVRGHPTIAGGEDAKVKEFPHMAAIGYGEEDQIQWACGSSLISERFLLTAAHCTDTKRGRAKWAKIGALNLYKYSRGDDAQQLKIIEWINHPDYRQETYYKDIALYKLERDVRLGPAARPACLQVSPIATDREVVATGWGRTAHAGRSSDILQKVDLAVLDMQECRRKFRRKIAELPNGLEEEKMLCVGDPEAEEKDTCHGDSGGPVQYRLSNPNDCMASIVGLTSFGGYCGYGDPAIYTPIHTYISWIEKTVWPSG